MDRCDLIRTAWKLCSTCGPSAELEADSLAYLLAQIGADQAASVWRDVAQLVRTIQQNDANVVLH